MPPVVRQSFAGWSFFQPDGDPWSLLAEAAAIGYRGVEILDRQYWPAAHEAHEAGLTIVAICGQESQRCGWNDPRNHADLRREILTNPTADIWHRQDRRWRRRNMTYRRPSSLRWHSNRKLAGYDYEDQ
jgi:hypothetical protein